MTVVDRDAYELVDAHCHVDLFPDSRALTDEIERTRVHTIAVTNAPSVFFHTRDLAKGKSFLYPAVGLHPELVATHGHELESVWAHLDGTRFVGEVGLDYVTADQALRKRQRDVFSAILLRCAAAGDKVITVHSRRSAADVIAAVGPHYPGRVILHWFSGSVRELERAIDFGFYFSVNPSMARSKSGQQLMRAMPKERVLTETDAPFVKLGTRPAKPSDVVEALRPLAAIWDVQLPDAAAQVLSNFSRLLGESLRPS